MDNQGEIDPGSLEPFSQNKYRDLETLSSTVGRDFLRSFVEILQDAIEADMVAISELRVMEEDRIHVLAGGLDGGSLEDFEYEACVTPCFEVINCAHDVIIHQGVRTAYPKDDFFIKYGIESYLGIPLLSSESEVVGLVQLAWRHKISSEETSQISDTIKDFSARLASELENLQTMRILSALARGSDELETSAVFRLIAQQMQIALNARTVFLAECAEANEQDFCILAYCNGGNLIPDLEGKTVPYEGSPCANLKTAQEFKVSSGLADAFPTQLQFRTEGLDSYLGVRISDHTGGAIGHFAILHDHPISKRKLETELLRIFSDRFGSELRRRKASL
ncbi:GAF domain-containing protein [Pseudophaeobacter sp. EL27]|uniref:GAF domain-containing protein n=1 Tax=Pseudophaeobacter sp. EL27 TaxID=2107580 RepID=UPI0013C44C9C|nr:GAF domain-containing protein [Pseudophaeobacter sp. EL27]